MFANLCRADEIYPCDAQLTRINMAPQIGFALLNALAFLPGIATDFLPRRQLALVLGVVQLLLQVCVVCVLRVACVMGERGVHMYMQ